jgi:hypothetical protein
MFNYKLSFIRSRLANLKKANTIRPFFIDNSFGRSYRDDSRSLLPSVPLGTTWGNLFWTLEDLLEAKNIRNVEVVEFDPTQTGDLRKFSISAELGLYVSPTEEGRRLRGFERVTYNCPPSKCVWIDGKPKITAHLKNFFLKYFKELVFMPRKNSSQIPTCTITNYRDATFEVVEDPNFHMVGVAMKITMDIVADFSGIRESFTPASDDEKQLNVRELQLLSDKEFDAVLEDFKRNPPKNISKKTRNFFMLVREYKNRYPNIRDVEFLVRPYLS